MNGLSSQGIQVAPSMKNESSSRRRPGPRDLLDSGISRNAQFRRPHEPYYCLEVIGRALTMRTGLILETITLPNSSSRNISLPSEFLMTHSDSTGCYQAAHGQGLPLNNAPHSGHWRCPCECRLKRKLVSYNPNVILIPGAISLCLHYLL